MSVSDLMYFFGGEFCGSLATITVYLLIVGDKIKLKTRRKTTDDTESMQ